MRGTVPYMQTGEAAPRTAAIAHAGRAASRPLPIRDAAAEISGERNTETIEPTSKPASQ